MSKQNSSLRKKKNTKKSRTNKPAKSIDSSFVNLSKQRMIIPDRFVTRLRWSIQKSYSLAASTAASFRYRPTAAYDVDPLLGNTSLPGLTELNALWEEYRVLGSKIRVSVSNTSNTIMPRVTAIALLDDPTSSPSTSIMTSWWNNPFSVSEDVPLLGGGNAVVQAAMRSQVIFGNKQFLTDAQYTGTTSNGGIPAVNWYWGVCLVAPVTMATAIPVTIDIWVDIEFFHRARLLN